MFCALCLQDNGTFPTKEILYLQVFELPTLKAVINEIEGEGNCDDESWEPLYQGQRLKYYQRGKQYIHDNCVYMLERIIQCYNERYWFEEETENDSSTNDHLIFPICKIINAAAWPKLPNDDDENDETILDLQVKSVSRVFQQFSQMNAFKDVTEDDMVRNYVNVVRFCQRYFNYEKTDPTELWHKVLLQCEDKPEWRGLSLLIELCLCTPCSNATLERFFSQLKVVKTEQRTALSSSSLNALLRIKLRQLSSREFHDDFAEKALSYWYNDKSRRIHQSKRKQYKKRKVTVQSRAAFNVNTFTLDDFSSDDEDLDVNFSSDESENDL